MKKFIIKTCFIAIIPIVLTSIFIFFFKQHINQIKVDPLTQILILGDSHTKCAINDSVITNSLNISQASEHFLYSYNVLKLLLNNNPQIEKVILGVSFHSFTKSYDKYINEGLETGVSFPKYFSVLDKESILDVHGFQFKQVSSILKTSLKFTVKQLFTESTICDYPFIGGFYRSHKSHLNDSTINSAIQRHYFQPTSVEYADYQLRYLKKIVEFCDKNSVELIFINTPIHNDYYKEIPQKFILNYYGTVDAFIDRISFYDFYSLDLPEDCYGDGDHLNIFGAKKFSLLINEIINKEEELEVSP